MARASHSAPAPIPKRWAPSRCQGLRQVAERGKGLNLKGRCFLGRRLHGSSSPRVVYDPSSPKRTKITDDELNLAGLPRAMGKGRIVAGCIAPHTTLGARGKPAQNEPVAERLGATPLGLRTASSLSGR